MTNKLAVREAICEEVNKAICEAVSREVFRGVFDYV